MRTYASATYISMILFIIQIEQQLHAKNVDVQVWTNVASMEKGDAKAVISEEKAIMDESSSSKYPKAKARAIADAVKTSDEEPPLKINLNINLNGISNATDGIEIVDDSEESIVTDGDAAERSLKNVESKATACWGGNYEKCAKNCEKIPSILIAAREICKLGCLAACPEN